MDTDERGFCVRAEIFHPCPSVVENVLQKPAAINFNHVQFTASPIGICLKEKLFRRAVEFQTPRFFRIVRVISGKFQIASGFRDIEQNHPVIDAQRRKFHEMNDWRQTFFNCREQIFSRAFLMFARNRKNHPPMAPQNIRPPRAAASGLQQFFPRRAEFAQARKAGNDDLIFCSARRSRIARNDLADQLPVNFIAGNFLIRVKPRVIQKLPRRARQHKTAECVVRFRLAFAESCFARRRVKAGIPKAIRSQTRTCRARIQSAARRFRWNLFWPKSCNSLGKKLRVRYQTDNALRTLEENCGRTARRTCAARFCLRQTLDVRRIVCRRRKRNAGLRPGVFRQNHFSARPFAGIYFSTARRVARK